MAPSPKTIRLQNKSKGDLSFYIMRLRAPASPGIRRRPVNTPIRIVQGRYYDMCKELRISYDEATALAQRDPHIQSLKNNNRLDILTFPPPPGQSVPPAPERIPPDPAATPPKPMSEHPAIMAREPERPIRRESMPQEKIEDEVTDPGHDGSEPTGDLPMIPEDVTILEEPSMDWTIDRLREYAEGRNIDLGQKKAKTSILRAIREAG